MGDGCAKEVCDLRASYTEQIMTAMVPFVVFLRIVNIDDESMLSNLGLATEKRVLSFLPGRPDSGKPASDGKNTIK